MFVSGVSQYQLCPDIAATPRIEFTLPAGRTFWVVLGDGETDATSEIITGQLQVFDSGGALLKEHIINIEVKAINSKVNENNWVSSPNVLRSARFRVEELDTYTPNQKYVFKIHIDDNPRMSLWLWYTTCLYYQLRYR